MLAAKDDAHFSKPTAQGISDSHHKGRHRARASSGKNYAAKFADTSNPPPPTAAPPLLREDTGLLVGTNWHEPHALIPAEGAVF